MVGVPIVACEVPSVVSEAVPLCVDVGATATGTTAFDVTASLVELSLSTVETRNSYSSPAVSPEIVVDVPLVTETGVPCAFVVMSLGTTL